MQSAWNSERDGGAEETDEAADDFEPSEERERRRAMITYLPFALISDSPNNY